MTDPHRTLTAARDVLTRARDARPPVAARVLRRLEQKIRLTEHALAAAQPAEGAGATQSGLRAVLARAEATTEGRATPPEQARAIEVLRAQIAQLEAHRAEEQAALAALVTTLAADTERVRAATSAGARTNGAGEASAAKKRAPAGEGEREGEKEEKKKERAAKAEAAKVGAVKRGRAKGARRETKKEGATKAPNGTRKGA